MDKKASKQTPTFESEASFLDELTSIKRVMEDMFSKNENLQKYSIKIGEIFRFCETNYHKNVLLLQKADEFNAVIVNNATKVSTMMKIFKEDNENINHLKEQYDKHLQVIKKTYASIESSKQLYKTLRSTVADLYDKVTRGEAFSYGDANSVPELSNEVKNLKNEKKKGAEEIESLTNQINVVKTKTQNIKQSLGDLKSNDESLSNSLDFVNKQLSAIEDVCSSTKDQILTIKPTIKEKKSTLDDMKKRKNQLTNTNTQLNNTKYELYTNLSQLKEGTKGVKERNLKRNKFLQELKNRSNMHSTEIKETLMKIEYGEQTVKTLQSDFETVTKETEDSQMKFDSINEYAKDVSIQKAEARKQARSMRSDLIKQAFLVSESSNNILQMNRKTSAVNSSIKTTKQQIEEQKKIKKDVKDHGTNVRSETLVLKGDMQQIKEKILQLYDEVDEKRTLTLHLLAKENLERDYNKQIIAQEDSHQKELEEYLRKNRDQDELSDQLREERNIAKKRLVEVNTENDELKAKIKQMEEQIMLMIKDDSEYAKNIIYTHEGSIVTQSENSSLEQDNKNYKDSIFAVERIISRLHTQMATLEYIIMQTNNDFLQQKKEYSAIQSSIDLIRHNIEDREQTKAKLTSDLLTIERHIDKSKHVYEDKLLFMLEKKKELDKLQEKAAILEEKQDKLNQTKYKLIQNQTNLLMERQKYSALVHEFSKPRNVHRWDVIEAVDPQYAAQLRYRASLSSKLDVAHKELLLLQQQKGNLEKELNDANEFLSRSLSRQEVLKRITLYQKDVNEKEQALKSMKAAIGGNQNEMNRSISNIDVLRGKVVQRRGATALIHSRTALASLKNSNKQNTDGWFLTETAMVPIAMGGGFMAKETQERKVQIESDLHIGPSEPHSYRMKKSPLLAGHRKLAKPKTPHTFAKPLSQLAKI